METTDMANPIHSSTCQGIEFQITADYRFFVPEIDKIFGSYALMAEGLREYVSAKEASARKKLDIPGITLDGKRVKVTGVHAGHGTLICKPAIKLPVYMDVGWAETLIKRLKASELETNRLRLLLDKLRIKVKDRWQFKPEDHAEAIKTAESQRKAAQKLVSEKTLDEALAEIDPRKIILD